MSVENDGQTGWRSWDAAAWSSALFVHFFATVGADSQPVSRLSVSPEELARSAGASDADSKAVLDAFLEAVRSEPTEFRAQLSTSSLVGGGWRSADPPPFLAHLFFTCYAAASLDKSTVNAGVFRERVRKLLKHSEGTSYPLTDLPKLWRALERWIARRRSEGAPYRALKLPDPGWLTLIGYSVRLAFPPRSDRLELVKLMGSLDPNTVPTVTEVLQLIGQRSEWFSTAFREVLDRARVAFTDGVDAPELEALWSAAVEARSLIKERAPTRSARVRYQLFLEEDELSRADPFLVASGSKPSARGVEFAPLDEESIDEYGFLVQTVTDGSTSTIARLVLLGAVSDGLPDYRHSPIHNAVTQGVLLFSRNDNATWELVTNRPDEGRVRALVIDRLSDSFRNLFASSKPPGRPSKYAGWFDIGPFEMASVGDVTAHPTGDLSNVRCLQKTTIGVHITLSLGIHVDGGFLGTSGLFPAVRCAGATEVRLFAVGPQADRARVPLVAELVRRSDDVSVFELGAEQGDLSGTFNLVATSNQQVIASREIAFHSRLLGHAYGTPTAPQFWIVEAAGPDVLSADVGPDCFLSSDRTAINSVTERSHSGGAFASTHGEEDFDGAVISVDDDPRLDRFTEAVAALSTQRRGIGESELLGLLQSIVGAEQGPGIWDVARAWLEAGYLDVLSRRRWRGRVYFARRPRLVVSHDAEEPTIVLHGMAPYRLRVHARTVLRALGASELAGRSISRSVGAPLSWIVESTGTAEAASKALGLGPLAFIRDPSQFVEAIESLTAATPDPLPGYECAGVWDWQRGGFRQAPSERVNDPVRVEWHTRADRPDLFRLIRHDGMRWATFSRNWALLVAHRWAETRAFSPRGLTSLARHSSFGPHIPLPVARIVGLQSGILSGPVAQDECDHGYAYRMDAGRRGWISHWLDGQLATDVHRHFAWLLSVLDDPRSARRAATLPMDIRRRLRDMPDIPQAARLAERRVPARLIPHLRRAIQRVRG